MLAALSTNAQCTPPCTMPAFLQMIGTDPHDRTTSSPLADSTTMPSSFTSPMFTASRPTSSVMGQA